jgi:glucokinase
VALGAAIGGFINIFNPELVVVGGGLAAVGDLLLEPARRTIPRHSFHALRSHARVIHAELGDDAGLYGAAGLALERA